MSILVAISLVALAGAFIFMFAYVRAACQGASVVQESPEDS